RTVWVATMTNRDSSTRSRSTLRASYGPAETTTPDRPMAASMRSRMPRWSVWGMGNVPVLRPQRRHPLDQFRPGRHYAFRRHTRPPAATSTAFALVVSATGHDLRSGVSGNPAATALERWIFPAVNSSSIRSHTGVMLAMYAALLTPSTRQ